MMRELIDLAKTAEDERVRSVCLIAVLDRAGIRPIDFDPKAEAPKKAPRFDPTLYTLEELKQMRDIWLMIAQRQGRIPQENVEGGEPEEGRDSDGSGHRMFAEIGAERPLSG